VLLQEFILHKFNEQLRHIQDRKAEREELVDRLESNTPPLLVTTDPYLIEIQDIVEYISAFHRKHINSDALKRKMKSLGFKNSIDPLICRKVRFKGSNHSMETVPPQTLLPSDRVGIDRCFHKNLSYTNSMSSLGIFFLSYRKVPLQQKQ